MNTNKEENPEKAVANNPQNIRRLKLLGLVLTLCGVGLFSYFVYTVGVSEIISNIKQFGLAGFAIILAIYFCRICLRAYAWTLSVHEPYVLRFRDTLPAVLIGEAMSSMIPLGILVSGTAKAIAVRRRVPMVVGLSSVATENLFYSFTTSFFLLTGAVIFLRNYELDPMWVITIDVLIGLILIGVTFLVLMVLRQWHIASEACETLYRAGYFRSILKSGRVQIRLFENLIFGFYRQYPRRFFPLCLILSIFHALGVLEVWFILSRISESSSQWMNAFLLESISRLITIIFKLIPFVIGVDEAGAELIAKTVALGAGVGLTLALIRKGRVLVWSGIGLLIILKRGLTIREFTEPETNVEADAISSV